jgi:hypothetical protein
MTAALRAEVAKGSPKRRVTVVVTVDVGEAVRAAASEGSPEERRAKLRAAFAAAKAPFVDLVRSHAGSGLRVSSVMEGSSSFIATGPAGGWRELLALPLSAAPEVRFSSNEASFGLPGG